MTTRTRTLLVTLTVAALALTGATQAMAELTVQIVEPETDPFTVVVGEAQEFEAVAFLDGVELEYGDVTWEWDFGDGTDPEPSNPTEHTYDAAGLLRVVVSAAYGNAEANVDAWAMVQMQAGASHQFSAEWSAGEIIEGPVCDDIKLVYRAPLGTEHSEVRFYVRQGDNPWQAVSHLELGQGELYDEQWRLTARSWWVQTPADFNDWQPIFCKAEGSNSVDFPVPQSYDFSLLRSLTSDNLVVKDATEEDGILLHEEGQAHSISWNTTHHERLENPTPGVLVDIYSLTSGDPIVTVETQAVTMGEGSCEWDGLIPDGGDGIPAPTGIYPYRIRAIHDEGIGCEDQDKSGRLEVSECSLYWTAKDPQAGELICLASYELSRNAGSVVIRYYSHTLDPLGHQTTGGRSGGEQHLSSPIRIYPPFDQNGELIEPVYCVVFADECDADADKNRDRQAKPALPRGTVDLRELPPLQITNTNCHLGDATKMIFDASDPNGTCSLFADGTAGGILDDEGLVWELAPVIDGSELTTSPADPPRGPSVVFTYAGLPSSNAEFGPAALRLTHPDAPGYADSEQITIYFRGIATNHGGDGTGETPNWYYYWKHGDVVADLVDFKYSPGMGSGSWTV
ncbi:MAG: PKD domain-containing protein, partial [Armatimonadota bacterium]